MAKNKKRIRPFAQDFSGESKTQQHFTESCDVNNIIANFRATGIDPYAHRATNQKFGYASSVSFTEAMQNIAEIKTKFHELPSRVRSDFQNDPAQWLDSLTTPDPPFDPDAPPEASEKPSEPGPTDPQNVDKPDESDIT